MVIELLLELFSYAQSFVKLWLQGHKCTLFDHARGQFAQPHAPTAILNSKSNWPFHSGKFMGASRDRLCCHCSWLLMLLIRRAFLFEVYIILGH